MGCLPNSSKPHKTTSIILQPQSRMQSAPLPIISLKQERKGKGISKQSSLSKSTWVNVIDFLNYSEVKEIGKVSRQFNQISKKHNILTKFFKKKNERSNWKANVYVNDNFNAAKMKIPNSVVSFSNINGLYDKHHHNNNINNSNSNNDSFISSSSSVESVYSTSDERNVY